VEHSAGRMSGQESGTPNLWSQSAAIGCAQGAEECSNYDGSNRLF
jgi:hypothetical protein